MTCANNTSTSAFAIPAQTPRWNRPAFLNAIVVTIEAFQEALVMRRAAQRSNLFYDE